MARNRANVRPGLRRAQISELVARKGEVSVEALAQRFNASPETIRRDLSALADAGQVQKVHGGARRLPRTAEGAFEERLGQNTLGKRLIAEKIVPLVSAGQTLFIDTGTTTLFCAEALARVTGLRVITNSVRIAAAFSAGAGNAEVYLLGGLFRSDNSQTVGLSTVSEIAQYQADHAIIAVGSVDSGGVFDYSKDETRVARAMIGGASRVTIVADSTKFGQGAPFRVCELESIDVLVADKSPKGEVHRALLAAGVKLL